MTGNDLRGARGRDARLRLRSRNSIVSVETSRRPTRETKANDAIASDFDHHDDDGSWLRQGPRTSALARGRAGGRRQRIASRRATGSSSPRPPSGRMPSAQDSAARVPRRGAAVRRAGDENSEKKTQKKKKKRVVS